MKIIEDGFIRLANQIPALAINVSSAFSAVRASWERAMLPEKRLSSAARHSIAVYIVGVVGAAFQKGTRSDDDFKAMGRLLKHATAIDATASERHVKVPKFEADAQWNGPEGGPWSRKTKSGWSLGLVHSPRMPGGRWTVTIGDMPCLYGDDPRSVESDTLELLEGVDRVLRDAMLKATARTSMYAPR
nr:hypothetical protein [Neorhizobium tomejilense]